MRFLKIRAFGTLHGHLIDYPTPIVSYISSFGSLSGICLTVQILTGVLLAAHYTPHTALAFLSLEHIMRDVNDGWIFRYYHSNGASIFFFCLYVHIYNNFFSEAEDLLWLSGLLLYLLAIAIAFIGYVLPWGQISYWGATVITNMFSSIPLIGYSVSQWLWGGFSIANPTLNRFFSFHFVLPFLIVGVLLWHLSLLHVDESSVEDDEYVSFYYYYFIKDFFVFFLLILVYIVLVFFYPNFLSHPDNYSMASITNTPQHLVPEWYFWPFYAVLRSVPNKLGGLVLILFLFVDIFLLETLNSDDDADLKFSRLFDLSDIIPSNRTLIHIENEEDIGTFLVLFYLGGVDMEDPYPDLASALVLLHFFEHFDLNFEVDNLH